MLHAIEPYLLSDFEYKHSLVRLFLRPVFYMGYEAPIIASYIVNMCRNEEINSFNNGYELQKYTEDNIPMIAKIIEGLKLCCEYYDVAAPFSIYDENGERMSEIPAELAEIAYKDVEAVLSTFKLY